MKNSYLDWGQVRIFPESQLKNVKLKDRTGEIYPAELPQVAGDNHYAYARETDSAIVETVDARKISHFEKFLFYRGIGNFKLPLKFESLGQGRFSLTNFGSDEVRSLFLVNVEDSRVRFSQYAALSAHGAMYLELSRRDSTIDELGQAMVQSLIEAGLYEKEARSMVKTWNSSWFGEDGTRLLYLVPQRLTDEVLPISIKPQPDELIRVLVGRMEVLTPERADRLVDLVREQGTCFTSSAEPLRSELAQFGRFAEPALDHILRSQPRLDCREQLRTLLDEQRAETKH
jgi:hypothetical protein